MNEITLPSACGPIAASLFEPATEVKTVLILNSATGVRQEFYHKFAAFMAEQGTAVITYDYTGIGRSLHQPLRQLKVNVADWGAQDFEAVLNYATEHYPLARRVVMGHSIGGQIIGLAPSSVQLDKIVLVASQSGYWKLWRGFSKWRMAFNWYVLLPGMVKLFGYLYSKKITGMENLPKNVVHQWRGWGKHPDYFLSDKSLKHYYHAIKTKMSVFSIEDDYFAPPAAVAWLRDKAYSSAPKEYQHLKAEDFGHSSIGHFGIFKSKFRESIWLVLMDAILEE